MKRSLACTKRLGEFSYERSGPALIARRVIDDVGPLPQMLEGAWARALPGRGAAAHNECCAPFSRVRFRANRTLNQHRRMIE